MASAESTYDERLDLADSFDEYKEYFSQEHYKFLVKEALDESREGVGKLKYILKLARRCKIGGVPVELLASKISKEYSLNPLPQVRKGGKEQERVGVDDGTGTEIDDANDEQSKDAPAAEGEAKEALVVKCEDMETDVEDAGEQQHDDDDDDDEEEDDDDEEEEAPHVDKHVKKLIKKFELTFFARHRWAAECKPFTLPGEGYWLDAYRIESFRSSTYEDFAVAVPKPMPVFLKGNPFGSVAPRGLFRKTEKTYHLCRKVAVSSDGKIYRATDAEIQAALQCNKKAPSCSAATYVKAVQEMRRRHAITRARLSGSG